MYWNGTNLYLTGSVNATGGKFTGNVQLAIPAGATTSGTLFAGANPTSGARVRFSSEGIFAYDATSTDNATGQTFSLVQSTGRLNANLGTVGGWTLATTGFSSSNTKIENSGNIHLGVSPTATLESIVRLSADDATYRLWVGSQTASNAPFRVSKEGVLYATGAQISGQLVITSGSTYDSITSASSTATSASNTATAASNTATAASGAASTAQSRADAAYNKAVAAGDAATVADGKAVAAADLANLKVAAADVASAINNNTTTISGSKITTGTISLNKIEVVGDTTNGLAIDTSGIRAYSGSTQTFNLTSNGSLSLTGNIYSATGRIGGFDMGNGDLTARNADLPRIIFSNKVLIGYDSGPYTIAAGNPYTDAGGSFYVNTNSNVFRFAADSSARSYAAEIRNTVRATNLRYITGLINDSSSRRFKENITYLPESYYKKILDVKPAFYTYIDNHPETDAALWGTHAMGPIAEDLEEAGLGFFVERNLNGEPTALRNEHKLTYLLIPLVKEMKEKIDSLETRLIELENANV